MQKATAISSCYIMSSAQLNELWHHDMKMANVYMSLPIRKCCAIPVEWPPGTFPPMSPEKFEDLKAQIESMWSDASEFFVCQKGLHGWGLFIRESVPSNKIFFSSSRPAVMGWLAKHPSDTECPTIHRYLRSQCTSNDGANELIYLGGPISLANFNDVSRVLCKRSGGKSDQLKNKMLVYKVPGRVLAAGQEVLWDYNLDKTAKTDPKLGDERCWKLSACCSEGEPESAQSSSSDEPPRKKWKMGGRTLQQKDLEIPRFKYCTYCGDNTAATMKKGNIKRHWSLKHAVELCKEMNFQVDNVEEPVAPRAFMLHLDKVDNVYLTLQKNNFQVIPACNFFAISGISALPDDASAEEKAAVFAKFKTEQESMFRKYHVVFLKGISTPQTYEDLLKPKQETNYANVTWLGTTPSTNNFSISCYNLTVNEEQAHAADIFDCLCNAVHGCAT